MQGMVSKKCYALYTGLFINSGVPLTTEDKLEDKPEDNNEKSAEAELGELLDDDVSFVCDDATNRSPFEFSHIYMYDCIFSEDTYLIYYILCIRFFYFDFILIFFLIFF